ncbi:phage tail family protein [Bacillus toyonensis]|uniref:phage tail family protein n=1 Tax=Bacillus toyonensis TaxID=155322 RepID=UPI000C01B06F|nr:phage tail family protein [Bacillus toyonensis]PGB01867.1 phage tail protein [Bacillus toyonensis]
MHVIIEKMNGERYKLSKETGYILLKFRLESIKVNKLTERISGGPLIRLGTEIDGRFIHTDVLFTAYDFPDHVLKRNEFFKILDSREDFYVIYSEEPGKRWLVSAEGFTPEPLSRTLGRCELVLYSTSPYSESIGTTLDPFTFDSALWQIGQGILADDIKYTHSTTTFSIYNAGDVPLNPRRMPLLITFKGASTNLKIKNKTTGDEWSYTGNTSANDIIRLDQVRFTKNSLSLVRDTNKKLITLNSGFNDFEITGATGAFSISFDFRFYYL